MIDKTAIIHPSAQIAEDAIIGPYVVIGEGVKIGSGTRVISNAHIEHAEIGKNCTISPFATIGSEPQDLGYKGEDTKVVIGDETIIKENVTIHRGAACGDYTTRIGNKCLLMVGSHVAHNCVLADQVILANLVTLGGHVHSIKISESEIWQLLADFLLPVKIFFRILKGKADLLFHAELMLSH